MNFSTIRSPFRRSEREPGDECLEPGAQDADDHEHHRDDGTDEDGVLRHALTLLTVAKRRIGVHQTDVRECEQVLHSFSPPSQRSVSWPESTIERALQERTTPGDRLSLSEAGDEHAKVMLLVDHGGPNRVMVNGRGPLSAAARTADALGDLDLPIGVVVLPDEQSSPGPAA